MWLQLTDFCQLIDFGFADCIPAPGALLQEYCGSPQYSAPEVVEERPYRGPELDVWSLGVVLYTMLSGALPFMDMHDFSVHYHRLVKADYRVPGHVSTEAKRLIDRMLVVDPKRRASLDEVLQHPWLQPCGDVCWLRDEQPSVALAKPSKQRLRAATPLKRTYVREE